MASLTIYGLLYATFSQPQQPIRSYPLEAIGPLSCTKDGVYLAGGALSGNVYLWEVCNHCHQFLCPETFQ